MVEQVANTVTFWHDEDCLERQVDTPANCNKECWRKRMELIVKPEYLSMMISIGETHRRNIKRDEEENQRLRDENKAVKCGDFSKALEYQNTYHERLINDLKRQIELLKKIVNKTS